MPELTRFGKNKTKQKETPEENDDHYSQCRF